MSEVPDSPSPTPPPMISPEPPPGNPGYEHYQRGPGFAQQLIPTANPNALIGYYMGVFSLIPLVGNFLGPAALILGMSGLKAIKKMPGLPGKGHAITALILGAITTLFYWAITIMVIFAMVTRPKFR